VLAGEKAVTALAVLRRTVAFYRSLGVEVERVMTDNGAAYPSTVHAVAGYLAFATSVRMRTGRNTNGKAERFVHPHDAE